MPKTTAAIKAELLTPRPVFDNRDLLGSGSTLLNLGCTDCAKGAFPVGKDILIAGESDSGKTVLALSCFAEASADRRFKDYRLIFDDSEDSDMLGKAAFLGKTIQRRLEPPQGVIDDPRPTETVEEFYYVLDDLFKDGRPFIYVKDSETSLRSLAEDDKFVDNKGRYEKGKDLVGSYGDGKAAVHKANLRRVRTALANSGSILIMISHLSDNIGWGAQFQPKRRPGGHAMKYYATIEMWLSIVRNLTAKSHGTELQTGILAKLDIKKNHHTGKKRTVTVPIYHSYGIDDTGANIDFLVEKGVWSEGHYDKNDEWAAGKAKNKASIIDAKDLGVTGTRGQLIDIIEKDSQENILRSIVEDTWLDIEDACSLKRKPRYV